MWSIVKSLQRLIFRNGGSSIVLVYTASFFDPSYYSDMWESQHPGRRVMHVGERSSNSKFSYVSPRSIYGETSNEGKESASTYPCRSLSGSVQVNGVDGVVLVVLQITDDQVPNGRHLRVQHTYSPVTSPMP